MVFADIEQRLYHCQYTLCKLHGLGMLPTHVGIIFPLARRFPQARGFGSRFVVPYRLNFPAHFCVLDHPFRPCFSVLHLLNNVCVCVCVRERERECVCVCMCKFDIWCKYLLCCCVILDGLVIRLGREGLYYTLWSVLYPLFCCGLY